MKTTLIFLAFLLLSPLHGSAQQTPAATVHDRLWLFACPPGGDAEYLEMAGVRGGSRMTPVEGAHWLGLKNLLFVTQDNTRPKAMWTESTWKAKTTSEQWSISFESMQQVKWSAVGSSGGGGLKTLPDILTLAKRYPNVTGIYLDDFIKDRTKRPDGRFSGKPAMRLKFCTACPAAPLTRLSSAESKMSRPVRASNRAEMSQKFVPVVFLVSGRFFETRTNGSFA
jgi:hypothetical protein